VALHFRSDLHLYSAATPFITCVLSKAAGAADNTRAALHLRSDAKFSAVPATFIKQDPEVLSGAAGAADNARVALALQFYCATVATSPITRGQVI